MTVLELTRLVSVTLDIGDQTLQLAVLFVLLDRGKALTKMAPALRGLFRRVDNRAKSHP